MLPPIWPGGTLLKMPKISHPGNEVQQFRCWSTSSQLRLTLHRDFQKKPELQNDFMWLDSFVYIVIFGRKSFLQAEERVVLWLVVWLSLSRLWNDELKQGNPSGKGKWAVPKPLVRIKSFIDQILDYPFHLICKKSIKIFYQIYGVKSLGERGEELWGEYDDDEISKMIKQIQNTKKHNLRWEKKLNWGQHLATSHLPKDDQENSHAFMTEPSRKILWLKIRFQVGVRFRFGLGSGVWDVCTNISKLRQTETI